MHLLSYNSTKFSQQKLFGIVSIWMDGTKPTTIRRRHIGKFSRWNKLDSLRSLLWFSVSYLRQIPICIGIDMYKVSYTNSHSSIHLGFIKMHSLIRNQSVRKKKKTSYVAAYRLASTQNLLIS